MRKTAGWMAALLLLAAFGFVGHAQPKRSLTILVYMCGSNLESEGGAASRDIEEMTAAFSADGTGLLVMTGGSSKWANGIESNQTCVTEIGAQGRRRVVDSQASRSMGDPDTLSGFIRYARDYMPAEDYALILWDHGAGPLEGLCYDELYDSDHLTLGELQMALEGAALPGKLAWIGFDACLMSSMEVASKMAPYAEYMIASEAEEPVSGWNYAFLEGIGADADGAQTGRRIVECYMEAARETAMDLTLACIRLDAMDAVERSLDDMYGAMSARLSDATFSRLSRLRLSATGFGKAAAAATTATGFDLVDVLSLCECYGAAEWLLELENRHDAMQYYWLYDLQIDGANATFLQWHDGEAWRAWEEGTVGVPAGETLKLRVGAGTAPGDGSGGVSGKLAVYSQDMELRFLAPFYAANGPDRDTGAAGGWLSDIMPASAEFPFSMRYSLIVKPAEYAEDAELIINAAMTNESDAPLAFSVAQVSLNGASLEGWFDSQEGAGPSAAPGAIAPGETRATNIILNRADLSGLSQDVSIRKIDFMIYVRSPIPGNAEDFLVVGAWPVSLAAEIPLTAFASETTALPSRQLLPSDPGEADGRVLFSNGDCDVTLEGLSVVRGTPVLLLRCANGSERAWTVYLGQATLNGREADIGRTGNVLVSSRNNRVRAFELDREHWKLPRGAVFRVEPGQVRSLFVSVSPPEGGAMEKLEALTMRAYMVEAGEDAQDSEYVLFDAAGLRLPDGIDLDPAGECRVDPGALEVAQGRPLAPDARPDILSDEVWTPEASVSDGMRLSFELPEGETMQTAKYLLMRRVRSAAELADMSILSGTNEKTRNAEISFAGQAEWMIFEASGEMRVSEDGRSAFADYPALRAAARFSDGSIPLAITEIRREEDGSITFEQDVSNFLVMSSAFPGAGVDYMLNQIRLRYDPQTHEAGIASANEEWHGNTYSGLADCAQFGYLLLFPADATPGELAQYVCGEGPNGQYQFQVHALEDHRLQLPLEPVDDPENYCVVFWHYSPKTGVQCTAPRPLDAFTG